MLLGWIETDSLCSRPATDRHSFDTPSSRVYHVDGVKCAVPCPARDLSDRGGTVVNWSGVGLGQGMTQSACCDVEDGCRGLLLLSGSYQ